MGPLKLHILNVWQGSYQWSFHLIMICVEAKMLKTVWHLALSIRSAVYTTGSVFVSFRHESEQKFHLKYEQDIESNFASGDAEK